MFASQFSVFLNAVQGEETCWISDTCVNIIIHLIISIKQTAVTRPSGSWSYSFSDWQQSKE